MTREWLFSRLVLVRNGRKKYSADGLFRPQYTFLVAGGVRPDCSGQSRDIALSLLLTMHNHHTKFFLYTFSTLSHFSFQMKSYTKCSFVSSDSIFLGFRLPECEETNPPAHWAKFPPKVPANVCECTMMITICSRLIPIILGKFSEPLSGSQRHTKRPKGPSAIWG